MKSPEYESPPPRSLSQKAPRRQHPDQGTISIFLTRFFNSPHTTTTTRAQKQPGGQTVRDRRGPVGMLKGGPLGLFGLTFFGLGLPEKCAKRRHLRGCQEARRRRNEAAVSAHGYSLVRHFTRFEPARPLPRWRPGRSLPFSDAARNSVPKRCTGISRRWCVANRCAARPRYRYGCPRSRLRHLARGA